MQIKTLLISSLIGFAAAAPLAAPVQEASAQDVKDIVGAIQGIATALTALDTSVKALTNATDPAVGTADLTAKSAAILEAVAAGTKTVQASKPISLLDAIQLTSASSSLSTAAASAIDGLIAKKAIVDTAGQTATVLQQLQQQKAATTTFIDELKKKLPAAVAGLAGQAASAATDALQKGIVAFGGQ